MLESGEVMTMSALRWTSKGVGRGEGQGESPIWVVDAAEEPKAALVGVTVTVRWEPVTSHLIVTVTAALAGVTVTVR